jgi:hypothetical protein
VGACRPRPRWEGRGASRVVAVGLSAARGVEEKLGLKGGKRSGLSSSGGWGQARPAE